MIDRALNVAKRVLILTGFGIVAWVAVAAYVLPTEETVSYSSNLDAVIEHQEQRAARTTTTVATRPTAVFGPENPRDVLVIFDGQILRLARTPIVAQLIALAERIG